MLLGEERFPIAIRLPADIRNDPERLRSSRSRHTKGELVRLDQVAEIKTVDGPILINREQAHRRAVVMSNVSGRDLGSFVKACKAAIAEKMPLPPGYRLEWGGQYENQQRAQQRLLIVFPVSLLIISAATLCHFSECKTNVSHSLDRFPSRSWAAFAALWLRGINLNLSACVGFIALFGIAVLNGVVMVSHINLLRKEGKNVEEAVHRGCLGSTAAGADYGPRRKSRVYSDGNLHFAWSGGRAAARNVVIGGLITATILTLYVLPLMYPWFSKDVETGPAERHAS